MHARVRLFANRGRAWLATSAVVAQVSLVGSLAAQDCVGTWTLVAPSGPILTTGPVAFDEAHGQLLQFGGLRWTPIVFETVNETWTWDGSTWDQRMPQQVPETQCNAAATFDSVLGAVVLAGGGGCNDPSISTWIWDGDDWIRVVGGDGPGYAGEGDLAYDPIRALCVLHKSAINGSAEGTWEFDGQQWVQLAGGDTGYGSQQLAWDYERQSVMMFCGLRGGYTNEVREWTGADWSYVTEGGPPGRTSFMLVSDPDRHRIVLFGGNEYFSLFNDTWEWDGHRWWQISVADPPAPRYGVGGAFDTSRRRVMMVGGFDSSSLITYSETWEYQGPNVPIVLAQDSSSICARGDSTFSCVANAGDWSYQWSKDGAPLVNGGRVSGATSPVLSIADSQDSDAGSYQCLVSSACGEALTAELILAVCPFCPGDLSGDSVIDLADLGILLANYGSTSALPEDGDLDGDADVDLLDLASLLAVYGTEC